MYSESTTRNKGRFRRVSKARIFDGNPLKVDRYSLSVMVFLYVIITVIISLFFSRVNSTDYFILIWTLLPGAILGVVLLVTERLLTQIKSYLHPRMGKLLTAFLLFFVHIICYLALSSIIVSYPIGYIMEKIGGLPGMASRYSLFSGNFFIVIALFSWLRNMRTFPHRCF